MAKTLQTSPLSPHQASLLLQMRPFFILYGELLTQRDELRKAISVGAKLAKTACRTKSQMLFATQVANPVLQAAEKLLAQCSALSDLLLKTRNSL